MADIYDSPKLMGTPEVQLLDSFSSPTKESSEGQEESHITPCFRKKDLKGKLSTVLSASS